MLTSGIGGIRSGGSDWGEDEFKDQPRLINVQDSFELKPYIKEHNLEDTMLCLLYIKSTNDRLCTA